MMDWIPNIRRLAISTTVNLILLSFVLFFSVQSPRPALCLCAVLQLPGLDPSLLQARQGECYLQILQIHRFA